MKTKLKILGVVGHPIAHSLSPVMQNAALAHLGLPYLYMPFDVAPDALELFCEDVTEKNIAGFNVTIPHKQTIIPFLTRLTREARLVGAVNTVVCRGGKLTGDNTDGAGFLLSLKNECGVDVSGKHVLVLGAGGATRAIVAALGMAKAQEVAILNRTEKNAHELAHEMGKKFPRTVFNAGPLEKEDLTPWTMADLVVNTTPMGMKGIPLLNLPLNKLPSHAVVSDIVYTPLLTPLLKKAKKRGLQIHPGWGMLLYQGAFSFEKWTGKKPPVDLMKKALIDSLKR